MVGFRKYDVIVFTSIIILAVIIWIGFFAFAKPAGIVQVVYNGNVIKEYKLGDSCEYIFELPDGRRNVIEIENDVYVSEANCPDGICKQKRIRRKGEAIVCVPNELIVRIK